MEYNADVLPHDLFSEYLSFIHARRRPQTFITYESDLKVFRKFLESTGIQSRKREISPRMLDLYLSWLKHQEFASATIERRLQVLKSFFRWAIQRRYLRDDPFIGWDVPRAKDPTPRALSPEEDMRFLALLASKPTRRYDQMMLIGFRLARFAGLRLSECSNVKWENVDLLKPLIVVRGGKGDRDRVIQIPDAGLKQPLMEWWEITEKPDGGYVLSGLTRRPLRVKALSQSIRRFYRDARVVGCTFHTLRATYATRLMEKNVHPRTIQELLGHRSLETTMRYLQVVDLKKKEAVALLDEDL